MRSFLHVQLGKVQVQFIFLGPVARIGAVVSYAKVSSRSIQPFEPVISYSAISALDDRTPSLNRSVLLFMSALNEPLWLRARHRHVGDYSRQVGMAAGIRKLVPGEDLPMLARLSVSTAIG
jgi:hypothetical protein